MPMYKIDLPPLTRATINLLHGDQVIEVGIQDGKLVATVPGYSGRIVLAPGYRLRVEFVGLEPVNAPVRITSYLVSGNTVDPEK
jgi:hypothetical protein